MEQMREEGAKLLCKRLSGCSGFCHAQRCAEATENYGNAMDAALSLMQPEIDRRVAEEKAKLLAGLREPSEAMLEGVAGQFYAAANTTKWSSIGFARRAFEFVSGAFEKDNSHD